MSNSSTLHELFGCMDKPLDSVNLRRFFLMLFRAHWMDTANHGSLAEFFDCMRYDDDPKKSTVDVQLAHNYDEKKGSARPAIFVGFEGFTLKKLGIGSSVGRAADNSTRQEAKRADTVLRVGHMAQSADMALMMAESNAVLLQGIEKDIIANMDILGLEVLGWSDPRIMEKAPDRNFQVDLRCAVTFNFMVEIDIESHRIKKFGTELNASTG
jgi:hypothetical protein